MPFVAFHNELMCATYEINAVRLIECRDHVRAEQIAGAAWTHAPANDLLRVGPEQVAHGTFVWHLLFAIDRPNLIYIYIFFLNNKMINGKSIRKLYIIHKTFNFIRLKDL